MEKCIPKNAGYFCNFQKTAKENNHPLGENSPNLVTLLEISMSGDKAKFF
jgi:hypothetical protein